MNLCDRLQRPTPIGYGRRFHYCVGGRYGWDKAGVIGEVVERYSKRYGALRFSDAEPLYQRLARKYCVHPGWVPCYKSLVRYDIPDSWAHPSDKRRQSMGLERVRMFVDAETEATDLTYCLLVGCEGECRLCGGFLRYTLMIGGKRAKPCYREMNGDRNKFWGICRNPLCKAVAHQFAKVITRNDLLPMARVLMELTKNGDRTDAIAGIQKVADGYAHQFSVRRNRQKEGAHRGRTSAICHENNGDRAQTQ